jgi:hypothetical protein
MKLTTHLHLVPIGIKTLFPSTNELIHAWVKKIKYHTSLIFDAEELSGQAPCSCGFTHPKTEKTAPDVDGSY